MRSFSVLKTMSENHFQPRVKSQVLKRAELMGFACIRAVIRQQLALLMVNFQFK
jgi:hypothetical protein